MNFNLEDLVRENIKKLVPYSSARKEFGGAARTFLDANENSFGSPLGENFHRYPDTGQSKIKEKIAARENVSTNEIFVGNGSDEAIDLLFRIFCRPQTDNIIICPPTYGMYEVCAAVNDVETRRACLTRDFQINLQAVKKAIDRNTKLIFLCSPNNPTGNALHRATILEIIENFHGIVVVDEAYIHFSAEKSFVGEIEKYPNLVVLQTFSKAWGLAGLRVGTAFSNAATIEFFNRVKPPYNVGQAAQSFVLEALNNATEFDENVRLIIAGRECLKADLIKFPFVEKIYPTDANFVLAKLIDAEKVYRFLIGENIVVRNRSRVERCENCLRITVGTEDENRCLIEALKKL